MHRVGGDVLGAAFCALDHELRVVDEEAAVDEEHDEEVGQALGASESGEEAYEAVKHHSLEESKGDSS